MGVPAVTLASASGRVRVIEPFSTVSLGSSASFSPSCSLLSCSVTPASSGVCPTTSGTVTWARPAETTSVTVEPVSTSVPGSGFWLMTWSSGLELAFSCSSAFRPAFSSFSFAASTLRPTTLGISTVSVEEPVRLLASRNSARPTTAAMSTPTSTPIHTRRRRGPSSGGSGVVRMAVPSRVGVNSCVSSASGPSTGVASTGRPSRYRSRSSRISLALEYRLAGFLAMAFSTTASRSAGMSGTISVGAVGGSRTCL